MGYVSPWVIRWVIAVIATMIVWITWASMEGPEALWAPGHLSLYHANVKSCTQCHKPFLGPTLEKCVGCHTPQRFQQGPNLEVRTFHLTALKKKQSCLLCHTEHRGERAKITLRGFENPHGEFIFQATDARACLDCHISAQPYDAPPGILNNALVRRLMEEGEGAHTKGKFAKCLNCHGGGLFD